MTCIGSFLRCAGRATASVALIAGASLAISATIAEPAAAQGTSEARKDGWFAQLWSGASSSGGVSEIKKTNDSAAAPAADDGKSGPRAEGRSDNLWPSPSYVGAAAKKKTADDDAEPAAGKGGSTHSKEALFRPDPLYETKYDSKAQVDIYGAKVEVDPPRPLLELGRQQYTSGIYDESSTILGVLNPLLPGLSIYGDWRTAVAYNRNNGKDIGQIATRLNLDVDFRISATERIHAFFTPLQKGATQFTRYEFNRADGNGRFNDEIDLNPQTLFFEGDLGSIYAGLSGRPSAFDLPFTVGLFPLFLQNGIWANDAILGGAVGIPAKNSAKLGLPNFDITFFAAFDNVDNAGILGAGQNSNAHIYGVTTFIDAFSGYIEAGYGLIQGVDGAVNGQSTHFLTAAYSRRYAHAFSNSTRVFANFGNGDNDDGVAILSENSLITSLPSTLIPYANFFIGFGNPQPLVDGNGAGILKNVGINFETDALTGYPKLDDTASNAFGGAIGLQYLFNLDQQLLFEVATVQPFANDGFGTRRAQYAFGARYQIPLTRAWLLRADATYQLIEGEQDNFGVRMEMRRKF
jgi:hypothetical protein